MSSRWSDPDQVCSKTWLRPQKPHVNSSAVLRAQAQQIEDQNRRIQILEERLRMNSRNSSTPLSADRQRPSIGKSPSGKKRGAQPGHSGKERTLLPPEQITHAHDCVSGRALLAVVPYALPACVPGIKSLSYRRFCPWRPSTGFWPVPAARVAKSVKPAYRPAFLVELQARACWRPSACLPAPIT